MRLLRLVILLTAVAIVVFSAGIALGQPPANAVRALPDTVERGGTFNITVNFTAPADNFTAIALTDLAPTGWNVTVSGSWSQPSAAAIAIDNRVEFSWWTQQYPNGTNFTALYKVTVPCDANLTNYTFDDGNASFLAYFIGNSSQIWENITDDSNVTVVPPAICSESVPFYTTVGQNPQNKTLELWSSTPCMLNWSITEIDADWLEAYPTNGSCTDVPSPVVLSVNSSGMPLGNYTANITIESPDANNSPRIVPVTLKITLFGILEGQVDFTARGSYGPRWIESFEVKLFEPGNLGNVLWTGNATTNDHGVFTIPEVVEMIYDVGIKNATCLSALVTNVTISAGNVTLVDFGEVREGDANNDDYIDGSDYGPMSIAWNSYPGCPPPPYWDPDVDFNRDGYIDGSDYGPLSDNWNDWGDCFGVF